MIFKLYYNILYYNYVKLTMGVIMVQNIFKINILYGFHRLHSVMG